MKFKSITGREYKIDLRPSKWPRRDKFECRSIFQWKIGQILDNIFPNEIILEEFSVPGENLRVDFFLPRKMLAVEVMGEQHHSYIDFFHKTKEAFLESKKRDRRKFDWCEINNIKLVYVEDYHDEEDVVHLLSDI